MKITNGWLSEHNACTDGRDWWQSQKETDSIKVLKKLAKLKKWDWFRWLAPRMMTHAQKVEWAIFCAEQVLHIYEKKYPGKDAPRKAIEAAKAWLKDPSVENKKAAADAAAAAYAAYAAAYAADAAAAYAAYAAAYAAYAADAAAAYAAYAAADTCEKMKNICTKKAIEILSKEQPAKE